MKKIVKRLTYANVMSSIAVFLVIGGATAFAALGKNTVGTKQLKKNAVTTVKIKNNAVTGAKLNVGTLGQVPSAAHADSATKADSAGNAGNADTVGGLRIVKFSLNGPSPQANRQILSLNGLQLLASCAAGSVTLTATTSVDNGEISGRGEDASGGTEEGKYDDEFNVGDTFTLPAPSHSDVMGDGAYTGGDLRTVRFFYNEEDEIAPNDCLLNGYAIG